MASLFDTYMSSVSQAGQQIGPNTKTAAQTWLGSPEYQQGLSNFYAWRKANPGVADQLNPYYDSISEGGSARAAYMARVGATPQETKFIESGFRPAYQFITGGSQAAGGLLRQGYEDAYRARAAGFAGQQAEEGRTLGAQVSSQGLSPDAAMRLMAENRYSRLGQLAASRSQYATDLNTGLAELSKGTGTELAGLSSQEAAVMANYQAALKGAKAAKQGATDAGIASITGATLGATGTVLGGIFSDPRLKKNIDFHGMLHVRGREVPVYDFNYVWDTLPGRYRGVMAPDVEWLGVVTVSPSGWKTVDYVKLHDLTGFSFTRLDKKKIGQEMPVGV